MKSNSISRSVLILGLAFTGLLLTPQQAAAGPTELKAIAKQLNGGTLPPGTNGKPATNTELITFVNTKTSQEQSDAVIVLMKAKNASAEEYSGEILKDSNKSDFGTVFGQALKTDEANLGFIFNNPSTDPVKAAATKAKYIGTSAKLAATGTGAFAEWIDEFAFELTANNQNAYDAAKNATASKTAVGQLIGSQILNNRNTTDALRLDLAQRAMLAKNVVLGGTGAPGQGLSKSAQEIARRVGDAVSAGTIAQFTRDLVATSVTIGTKANQQPLLAQLPLIVTGTATTNSATAGAIVNAVFDGVNGNLNVATTAISPVFKAAVKNASKMAASVSLVADAEQVQAVAVALGARIGITNTDPTFKTKVVGIAQSQINGIVKGLVLGLAKRPTVATNVNGDNRTNRIDEIGEVGAYLMNAIKNLPDFQGKNNAGVALTGKNLTSATKRSVAIVTNLIKTVIANSAKVDRSAATGELVIPAKGTLVKAPIFQATVADDAAGSIAQTIRSLGTAGFGPGVFDAIKQALINDPKIGTKLAGSSKTLFNVTPVPTKIADLVKNALILGFQGQLGASADPNKIYEDGTIAANANDSGPLNNAETDTRNR